MSDEEKPDDEMYRCWCGASGPIEEMLSLDSLDKTCGGSGVLYCDCGGEFCVCHLHGETECDGCPDCEGDPDDNYDDDFDPYEGLDREDDQQC